MKDIQIYAVVIFYFTMVMYATEFETKEKWKLTKIKN